MKMSATSRWPVEIWALTRMKLILHARIEREMRLLRLDRPRASCRAIDGLPRPSKFGVGPSDAPALSTPCLISICSLTTSWKAADRGA